MAVASPPFSGFSPDAIQFLADLAANNERAWFQPRKADYERLLKEPLEALVAALAERFEARGIPLQADPKRSPFRIYRDTRFSKDKSPYKTQVTCAFPWREGTGDAFHEQGNPGGYFHLEPGTVYVGGGMWHPPTPVLKAFRQSVADEPSKLRRLLEEESFAKMFGGMSGDKLSRVPTGFPKDHPEAELLKLKDMTFGRRLSDQDVYSPALVDTIVDSMVVAAPVMRYLASLG
jgi:uncharacterized protein (TIGR02453 family)